MAEITTQDELISAAKNADFIGCIRIYAHPKPRAEIISVWTPDNSSSLELSVRQSVNAFVLETPSLNPPKYDSAFLFMCKSPVGDFNTLPTTYTTVTAVPIEDRCLLFSGHKLPLEDAKRLIRAATNTAQQDAAANP